MRRITMVRNLALAIVTVGVVLFASARAVAQQHPQLTMVEPGATYRTSEFDAGVSFEGRGDQYVLRTVWGGVAWGAADSVSAPHDIQRLQDRPRTIRTLPAYPVGR